MRYECILESYKKLSNLGRKCRNMCGWIYFSGMNPFKLYMRIPRETVGMLNLLPILTLLVQWLKILKFSTHHF